MRIVFLEPDPSFGGGSEQVCLDLACGLLRKGHGVTLLHGGMGTMLPVYRDAGIDLHHVPMQAFGWRSLPSSLSCARRLAIAAVGKGADVLFASDIQYLRLFSSVSWFSKIPLVFHLGLPSTHREFSWTLAYRKVAMGIAPSEFTLKTWSNDGWPAEKLVAIPNGVNCDVFRPTECKAAIRKELGLPESAPIVNYTGRLTPEKGIGTLLHAFSLILSSLPNAKLVLVGKDCGCRDRWHQLASTLNIPAENINFMGARPDRAALMSASDVVVVPSEWQEPFGLVAIEAMACAVPIVVTNMGVLPQILGSGQENRVVEAGDVAALARVIIRELTSLQARPELGLRQRAQSCFGIDAFCSAYENILSKVTGTSIRPRAFS